MGNLYPTFRGLIPGAGKVGAAASAAILPGNFVLLNSSGKAIAATNKAGGALLCAGLIKGEQGIDNTGGAADAIDAELQFGEFEMVNSSGDPLAAADYGSPCYVEAGTIVAKTDNSGTLVAAGIFLGLTADGAPRVFVGPLASDIARATAEADAGVSLQKRSLHLTTANVNAAATSQVINLGAALPANARILGVDVRLAVVAGTVTGPVIVKVGSAGDDDAVLASANLTSAAVDGEASTHTLGIAPNKLFATSTQLICTAVSSSGNLSTTTGLDATVDVLFAVLA